MDWTNYECEGQLSIFDLTRKPFKITNKIRLIELFGGVGSQAMALERLGADFEHWKLVEFDKYPVASYNAIHGTDFEATDITKINGKDLDIVDTDKYTYIMTYSFPCQDLSVAGKRKGMTKGSGTRSGLLWEVERLLNETENLPQVLVMENVTQVHSQANMPDFKKWIEFLESKGYSNYWEDLNARHYGIPQNRNRCFMVSLLGEYNFKFPNPIPIKKYADNYLEETVDEKYKIGGERVKMLLDNLIIDDKALTDRQTDRQTDQDSLTYVQRVHPSSRMQVASLLTNEISSITKKKALELSEVCAMCDIRYDEGIRVRSEMICPCITSLHVGTSSASSNPFVLERKINDKD